MSARPRTSRAATSPAALVAAAVLVLAAGQVLAVVGSGLAGHDALWVTAVIALAFAVLEPAAKDARVLPWVAVVGAATPVLAAAMEPRRVLAVGVAGVPVWAGVELLSLARAQARLVGPSTASAHRTALLAARRARLDDLSLVAVVGLPVALAVTVAALVDVAGGLVLAGLGALAVLGGRALLGRAGRATRPDPRG